MTQTKFRLSLYTLSDNGAVKDTTKKYDNGTWCHIYAVPSAL